MDDSGTSSAAAAWRELKIIDRSLESLRRFDQAFFDLYPYLLPLLRPERLANCRVLEIGLGYGTLGQKLAESAAEYTGLDIAANPVEMMNHRLRLCGRPGKAVQGSALAMPFCEGRFDFVVSIGCFHHTGNLQQCLDETYRVLAPGGTAFIMVYNKFSIRQWLRWPGETLRALVDEMFGPISDVAPEHAEIVLSARETVAKLYRFLTHTDLPTANVGVALKALLTVFVGDSSSGLLSEVQRAAYDYNKKGLAAPETVLASVSDLQRMLHRFEKVSFSKQNADDPLLVPDPFPPSMGRFFSFLIRRLLRLDTTAVTHRVIADRDRLLPTLSKLVGLDLYVEARKPDAQEVRHAA